VPAGDVSVAEIERGVPGRPRRILAGEGQRVEVHILYAGRGKWAIAPMVPNRANEGPSEDRLLRLGQAMATVWAPGPEDVARRMADDA
jgi:hypothetical protein